MAIGSVKLVSSVVAVTTLLFSRCTGLNNGLGSRPGLGWNSDYCTNCTKMYGMTGLDENGKLTGFQNEAFIKHIADYIHGHVLPNGKTMQQLGYLYINMDASWNLPTRDASGDLQPNPALWPSGMDNTIDYVHSLGLKFGLYGDRGSKDCAGNPGAYGHEKADANFFARNKIDFYKEDNCNSFGDKYGQYGAMRDALNATGRPIWFALCGWKPEDASDPRGGNVLANSARIGPDTGTGWSAVLINIDNGLSITQFTGPKGSGGFWADGSLMLTPGMGKGESNLMSEEKHRAQFNAWAVLGMNVLTVGNLSDLEPYVIDTWTNEEILAVNQDAMGYAAVRINATTLGAPMYNKASVAECGGEPTLQQWTFNETGQSYLSNSATKSCLNVEGCATQVIYDGCVTGPTPTCGGGHAGFHPNEMWSFDCAAPGKCAIKTALKGASCLTLNKDNTVSLSTCTSDAAQMWDLDAAGELKTASGMCVTASQPTPPTPSKNDHHIAIARRLTIGAAVYFLNNDNTSATMTCDEECFSKVNIVGSATYTIRDLNLKQDVKTATPQQGFNVVVPPGMSEMFSIMPA